MLRLCYSKRFIIYRHLNRDLMMNTEMAADGMYVDTVEYANKPCSSCSVDFLFFFFLSGFVLTNSSHRVSSPEGLIKNLQRH